MIDMRWSRRWRPALCVVVCAAVTSALAACGGSGGSGSDASSKPLTIGGWGGAIDKATQQYYTGPYSQATGQEVRFADAPGTQLAQLESQVKAGKIQWDALDSIAGDGAFTLYDHGRLATLPGDLKAKLTKTLGAGKVTDFGFSHANLGNVIACNMDKVKACPKTMAEFYDTRRFPGKRMFSGIEPIMAVATAQSAAGLSKEQISSQPVDLDSVFAKLEALKPSIKAFWTSGDQQLQIMRSGEVDMGIIWSGRAYDLAAKGMNLQINWGGGVYEPSYWAVVKGGNERDGFKLLDWIATHPDAQAKWATDLHYSVPNPKALESLPPDLASQMVDSESNFDKLVTPNFAWYAKNTKQLNGRYADFVRG